MEDLYPVLAEMAQRGETAVIATVIRAERSVPRHAGSKMIVKSDGGIVGTIGGGGLEAETIKAALEVLKEGRCRRLNFDLTGKDGLCGGEVEVFLEPLLTRAPFVIVGMGHVGQAVLEVGRLGSYRFLAVDDRPEFLQDLAGVETLNPDLNDLGAELSLTAGAVVLLCNRSHDMDGRALEAVFDAEDRLDVRCAYIGLVGSRTKAGHIRKRFDGDPERLKRFDQVSVPVGLDLGAETPHEIALSILAEVMAVSRKRLSESAGDPTAAVVRMSRRPRKEKP